MRAGDGSQRFLIGLSVFMLAFCVANIILNADYFPLQFLWGAPAVVWCVALVANVRELRRRRLAGGRDAR